MKNKHISWWIIVLVAVLVGALLFSSNKPRQEVSKEPIKIGGIFALTGLGASQGEQELRGAQLAVEEINKAGGINGRPVELVSEDVSLDKLNIAGSVAHKLVDIDHVVAIVGTTWDEPAQAILPITEAAKVPMVGQNQTRQIEKEQLHPYFFSTWYDNEVGVKQLLSFAQKKKWTKIAIIRPIPAGFYEFVGALTRKHAGEYGVEVVEDIALNDPSTTDFRTPLAKIKTKNPDAILIVLNGFTECPFLKQVQELNRDIPVLSTEAAADFPSLSSCPQALENLYISYPKTTPVYNVFAQKYSTKFTSSPETPSVMTSYDAVGIIAEGLRKTNGVGGEALREVLAQTKNFPGVSQQNIAFDSLGFVETPPDVYEIRTVQNGKFVAVE